MARKSGIEKELKYGARCRRLNVEVPEDVFEFLEGLADKRTQALVHVVRTHPIYREYAEACGWKFDVPKVDGMRFNDGADEVLAKRGEDFGFPGGPSRSVRDAAKRMGMVTGLCQACGCEIEAGSIGVCLDCAMDGGGDVGETGAALPAGTQA